MQPNKIFDLRIVITFILVLMMGSSAAAVDETRFMRGDQATVNSFTAYNLSLQQSTTSNSDFAESGTENDQVDWGIRVWRKKWDGSETEITGGSPVAAVSRITTGQGIQTGTWNPPETLLHPEDSIVTRVYIRVGGGTWAEKPEFTTEQLEASKLNSDTWTVNYYTQYQTDDTGNPNSRSTTGTFYWGTSTYNSTIESFNYSEARIEAKQIQPSSNLETYPGNSFNHSVNATCRAESCTNVSAYPQICQGASCTNFQNTDNNQGISWEPQSSEPISILRDGTISRNFKANLDSEGVYRIRFNVTSDNVKNGLTDPVTIDVSVADVNQTDLKHENKEEVSLDEYEAGDTIDYLNTTLTSYGGKAFDLNVSPEIKDPAGNPVPWGPSSTQGCGNLSSGSSCENEFGSFSIPSDAASGEYTFEVDYDWKNFGPETNSSNTFVLNNLGEDFNSTLQSDSVFRESSTDYTFNMTNNWSTSINNLNVTVNCDESQLNCTNETSTFYNSVGSGQEINTRFNISTNSSTNTGFYDVNVTINYTNVNEDREWKEVENRILKVTKSGTLVTNIETKPDRLTRGNQFKLKGNLENTGSDAQDVWLNWTLENGWTNSSGDLNEFSGTVSAGSIIWNNVTADIQLSADRGPQYINISSNNSDGSRGDRSFYQLDVFANTATDQILGASDAVRGETVSTEVYLGLDTGADVSDQQIKLVDETSGDTLGYGETDSNGRATISFSVPDSWSIQNHELNASFAGNGSIYTNPSWDVENLNVHDRPFFDNISESPAKVGFGQQAKINTSVVDQDNVSEVYVNVTYPDSSEDSFQMQNQSSDMEDFEYNFTDTFQNGVYSYSIWAQDEANYINTSGARSFEVRANATMDVATEKDEYGPNQIVWLNRTQNVTRNTSLAFDTLTREKYAEEQFSDSFNTQIGTSTEHINTHTLDGTYFTMTERAGEPPSTPDEFDGIYSYKTGFTDLRRVDINSLGSVTGGTWDVSAKDYSSDTWVNIYSTSSTTDTWDNHTICSGSTCNDYIKNGEIQIRTQTTSPRGTADSYDVDFQKLRIETSSGRVDENENPSDIQVGETTYNKQRYYRKFDLNQLPSKGNAQINSAQLRFNVSGGFGTGELHHTKDFTSSDSASNIHADGAPSEASQSNPIATFGTSEGMKTIDVTTAFNDTYNEDKDDLGLQLREQGEDNAYNISSPVYLEVNYTTDSQLIDTGSTDVEGYLVMRVQTDNGGSWQNIDFPVVDQSNGAFSLNPGESLDLAQVWKQNSGWNTKTYSSGKYRVLTRFTDLNGNTLQKDSGEPIRDSYNFEILQAELNLTDIEHENSADNLINEYETRDVLNWTNITVENSRTEAVNTTIDLNVLDRNNQKVGWGPDSLKRCGDVPAGGSCEKRWDNGSSGYTIPESTSSGTFEFRWNSTLEAENAETVRNSSVSFKIHHVPNNFSSTIDDTDNKIYRNQSTLYNFTVENPWSQNLNQVNVSIQCDETYLNCTELGSSTSTANIGAISAGGSQQVSFNVTTDENTPTNDYDLNATVEYVNPGNEERKWEQRENKILGVRIPGALLNITQTPSDVTRGTSGYEFKSFANNTYQEDLTNEWMNWTIPTGWDNSSGTLNEFEAVHTTGELVYNNFTASVNPDANLGQKRINISITNDQGRVDNDFEYIDVYGDTYLDLSFNTTDPAVNDTVKITGTLHYDNGTVISGESINIRDETEGVDIESGLTDSSGQYITNYNIDKPLGGHTINVSYSGSDTLYLRPSFNEGTLTVHDRPNITNVSANPSEVGFGYNTTLNATVQDNDGVSDVDVQVTYPNGTEMIKSMTNTGGSDWEYQFSETWTGGIYNFKVIATDNVGKTNTSSSSIFKVGVNQTSSIQTKKFDYYPAEYVNLTDFSGAWWNKSWDYRREIEINETSGSSLVDYPTQIQIDNLGSRTDSCNDLRVVEGLQLRDMYIESCNPGGTSTIYVSQNISALGSDQDVYLYYGNEGVSSYDSETYAYSIDSSGTYNPGSSSIDNSHEYNGGNASFRQIDITVYGSNLDATVTGYYIENDSSNVLFTGNPADAENILSRTYTDNPLYNRVKVQLQDTSGGSKTDVSYTYNFTTPDNTNSTDTVEREKLPSLLKNTGNTDFKGRVLLEVASNVTGSWQTVSTQLNDSSPRDILSGSGINLGTLWNSGPWFTDQEKSGYYRADFKLLDPSGNVLKTSEGSVSQEYVFKLNPPQTEIQIEDIKAYNVTGSASPKADTSDLKDSGTNTTLSIQGGESYRFDVIVNNSDTAQANWTIEPEENITYFNFNSSWTVNTNDIFYANETDTFTGGTFDGDVNWNTSLGGKVRPGDRANFSFIVDIPNNGEKRSINFRVNDSTFLKEDFSTLDVVKQEQQPPKPLTFELNDTEVLRGESFKGYAEWDEEIASTKAEYNSTTSVLNNFTVSPQGQWTNYSTSTDTDWLKGNHSFKFYASDANDNQNSTELKWFELYGLASVNNSELNVSEVNPGEPAEFTCQVVSDSGNQIDNYNVKFYNETSQIDISQTNSTGWASTIYSSEQIGFQDLSCNITKNDSRFYRTDVAEGNNTLRIAEKGAPEYFQHGSNVSRIYKTTRNETAKFYSNWTDNTELDKASLNVSGLSPSGSLPESVDGNTISLTGTQDWANFSYNPPSDAELRDQNWSVYANDTSSNINQTGEIPVDIWAWVYNEPGSSGPDKNPVAPDEEFKFYCNYVQGNGSVVRNYDVNFYDNNTGDGSWQKLGTNQTQEGVLAGFAEWSKNYSSTGNYNFKCNISESESRNLNPDPDFKNYSETIRVNTGDVEPPVIINDNYGLNVSEVYKGETILGFSEWNETIDYAEIEFNSTNSSLEKKKILEPYTDNWANATIDTNSSWEVGEHYFKTYVNDTRGNLNDTLKYLKADVYGQSRVDWYAPKDNATSGTNTPLKCRVSDYDSGVNISNYPVNFYDESNNFIDSNQTKSNGVATVYYDTSALSGDNTFSCNIGDEPQIYYNTSSKDSASQTVEILADMETSILNPANNTNFTRGETVWLNSTSKNADTGNSLTPDNVNWTNSSERVAIGENTTWNVYGEAGRQNISVKADKSSYDTGTDFVDIGIIGYSEIDIFEPPKDSSYTSGQNVELQCGVKDNRTGTAAEGLNVDFFVENSTQRWGLGQNQTNSTGNTTIEWDTTGFESGEYYPGCNITDQEENYFYASNNNETNTTVTLSAVNGNLNGTLTEPFDGISVAQNRTFDANATIECRNDDCGDVTATLRYNASGGSADTAISSTSDTPFYTLGSNSKSCGTLNQGASCEVSWSVNATGDQNMWHSIDVEMSGTTAQTNDTEDKDVGIDFVLILNNDYSKIEFPQADPGQTVAAPNNTNGGYFAELDENSNDANGGAWIKMTNLTKKIGGNTDNRIIEPENTTWAFESSCSYSGSESLHTSYSNILSSMNAGDNFTQCFWQEIPYGKYSGIYNGTLTIKVNATN